jgi:hypothetical protein
MNFETELKDLINKYSYENGSDTPDFIIAEYVMDCLRSFNKAVEHRTAWYSPKPQFNLDLKPIYKKEGK